MIVTLRLLVATLVLTGAAARLNAASTSTVVGAKLNAFPIPCCPPNDPNACHITDGNQ